MPYSEAFKAQMVRRMAGPQGISASALSKEVGVSQSTLSRWLRGSRTVRPMTTHEDSPGREAKSPRQWSAEEKLQVVLEAAAVPPAELGAFLRQKGLHAAQLEEWRAVATAALSNANKGNTGKRSAENKRIAALERELLRKDRALAEVTALLALKKKLESILGDEDDDTDTRSGR